MKTKLEVTCAWCKSPIRTVDGGGISGTSGGICEKCLHRELRKIRIAGIKRFISRLNPLNWLRHEPDEKFRGAKNDKLWIDDEETTQQEHFWITENPQLHAFCLLKGERYVSYLQLPEDLQDIVEALKDSPEMRARLN